MELYNACSRRGDHRYRTGHKVCPLILIYMERIHMASTITDLWNNFAK